MNAAEVKEQFDALFAGVDQTLSQYEYYPIAMMLDDQLLINLMNNIWHSIYRAAISAFVSVIENGVKTGKISEDEYNEIKYLLNKWSNLYRNTILDQQSYEDFKRDLIEFSEQYPDFFSNRATMLSSFEEYIWKPHFQQ